MDQTEFAIAAERESGKLYAHALKFTQDPDDARDLVQDTLVKAIRFSDKFETNTNLKSWLYVIMRNTFVNSYNMQKRKQELITTEEEISYSNLVISASQNASISSFALGDIGKALELLSEVHRVPFVKYFEGYKYEEIANELNIPLGTVKTRIHVAREQLKKHLKVHRK